MNQIAIELITVFIGTIGFCLTFHINRKRLLLATIGGVIAYLVFYIARALGTELFIGAFFAAGAATIYAEIMARVVKAPATVFLLPGIVGLAPGASLYYTMSSLVAKDAESAIEFGTDTLIQALGIAAGVMIVSVIVYYISSHRYQHRSE